jgi:hypothetical protein
MKKLFILSLLLICITGMIVPGCSTNPPIIVESMVLPVDTVLFHPPDSAKTISITHTCTCPFTWTATVTPITNWLVIGTNFPSYQSGDKSDVPVSINRSLLISDTSIATIHIVSNAYGDTSITVIAYRE